jgi:AbrB family looped-hinge helix DNA binding protein
MNRPIDYAGRLVLPAEIRNSLHIEPEDRLEIAVLHGQIILTPLKQQCKICHATYKGLSDFGICYDCSRAIVNDYNEQDIEDGR